jgi:hypothetical protein
MTVDFNDYFWVSTWNYLFIHSSSSLSAFSIVIFNFLLSFSSDKCQSSVESIEKGLCVQENFFLTNFFFCPHRHTTTAKS